MLFVIKEKKFLPLFLALLVGSSMCSDRGLPPSDSQTSIQLNNIFEYVTGVPESAGMPLAFEPQDNLFFITNQTTQKSFCCGRIEHRPLGWLRQQQLRHLDKPASFTVICYTGQDKSKFAAVDICALQANPENNDAVFQIASRMHGLEGGCVYGGENTEKGLGFNRMLYGGAQGEYASISAAPGTIYKMYRYEPINLLQETPFGHLINPKATGGGMPGIDDIVKVEGIHANWTNSLRIYFHANIDIVAGTEVARHVRQIITNQRINQIPVAAFDWRLLSGNQRPASQFKTLQKKDRQKLKAITDQMLSAFYEGTLLASALNGKHKIFLTAVGAGAFQNDPDLVMAAIANKRNLQIISGCGLEVKLIIHTPDSKSWQKKMDKCFKKEKSLRYQFITI